MLKNQEVKLAHGVTVFFNIQKEEMTPVQLRRLQGWGKPIDPVAIFWAIPIGFIGTSFVGIATNLFAMVTLATTLSSGAATVMMTIGVAGGVAFSAYGLIANTIYKRKLKFLQQAYDLVKEVKGKKGLLKRAYKRFKKKVSGVSLLEYAQRIVDLSYTDAFEKKKGRIASCRNMKKIVLASFQN